MAPTQNTNIPNSSTSYTNGSNNTTAYPQRNQKPEAIVVACILAVLLIVILSYEMFGQHGNFHKDILPWIVRQRLRFQRQEDSVAPPSAANIELGTYEGDSTGVRAGLTEADDDELPPYGATLDDAMFPPPPAYIR
ncbi:hypothetical protein B0H66DRAFT_603441 [Apodospora peruviana]|uniref:Uncharacterized protein n=1 Tax=Apodospora peruviana TaxID=516989 RepID=A0AAE0M4P3_9PEZI|nr:hypothetical protein B0H66DRAFT_603441 [Apodospora peruviana]